MNRTRSRLAVLGVLAIVLSLTAGHTAGVAAAKKKKGKVGGTVDISTTVGALIPDGTAETNGVVTSTVDVAGRKLNRAVVKDVNVTVQTLGATGESPAADLSARLTAPNGATVWLLPALVLFGTSVGPLTLDDESPNSIPIANSPPTETQLPPPYQGTAQPQCAFAFGACSLSVFDQGGVVGSWTIRVYDMFADGTSVFSGWRLNVLAGRPFKTR